MPRTFATRLRKVGARLRVLFYSLAAALLPIRRNLVVLQAHTGESLFGNPFYLARYLANEPDPAVRLLCVSACWPEDRRKLRIGSSKAKGIRPGGYRYALALATAEYLVCDTTFPAWFTRRPAQRYLNTWHGTPLKALGAAVPRTLHANLRNMQRNFLQADCILVPNAHTENVFLRDFGLAGLWSGTFLRCGYPRNDILRAGATASHCAPNIAYMPTWRGTHDTLATSTREHIADVERFLAVFSERAPATATLWVKLHPLMRGILDLPGHPRVREFPQDVETYEHLARCDTLVTDYSSVMVDFAAGGGRVLLFVPDLDEYARQQDFSIPPSALPFPLHSSPEDLVDALLPGGLPSEPATNSLLDSLLARENGDSTRSVCGLFFQRPPATSPAPAEPPPGRALLLVEQPLTPDTARALEAAIHALVGGGLSVTISFPGEAGEDALLVGMVKRIAGVSYCPSTSAKTYGGHRLPGIPGTPESVRLYGTARFSLVVMAGPCRYYHRLMDEFPRSSRISLDLQDVGSSDALRARLALLDQTGRH